MPFAVTAPGFVEPSDEDRAVIGQMFADPEPDPDYDAMAAEAEWYRQYEGLTPPPGHCTSYGEPDETNRFGLCGRCDDLADTIA